MKRKKREGARGEERKNMTELSLRDRERERKSIFGLDTQESGLLAGGKRNDHLNFGADRTRQTISQF